MARSASLSGFPEWLPSERLVERHVLEVLRKTFELHGFVEIETRAVEPVSQLIKKGETSKEIYLLDRLQARKDSANEVNPQTADDQLGLHFDLTVPLARYVVENAGYIAFPFKRYQIQKVWRGERPQDGRFREFIQADIDVVADGTLPAHYEIELPLVMARCLRKIPIPPAKVLVNNRKILQGYYEFLGITDFEEVLRCVDKLDKIGAQAVKTLLVEQGITDADGADRVIALGQIRGGVEVLPQIEALGVDNVLFTEGLAELQTLLHRAQTLLPGAVEADLKIARGLDYYTGMVYETVLEGHENLGSICSGGRYDRLASDGKRCFPGVGLSIGVSRLVARILSANLAAANRQVPTCVLVAVNSEDERLRSDQIADQIRQRGISADTSPTAAKFGKQIKYADRRQIPYVWFPGFVDDDGTVHADQVKDIRSGQQWEVDASIWQPDPADLNVEILKLDCD